MAILVCGGAGYIGSHTVRQLCAAGEEVIIADNFATGHRAAISPNVKLYECDIRDKDALKKFSPRIKSKRSSTSQHTLRRAKALSSRSSTLITTCMVCKFYWRQ